MRPAQPTTPHSPDQTAANGRARGGPGHDEPIRALVRLLARQAAREVISSSSVVDAGSRTSHDNGGPTDA